MEWCQFFSNLATFLGSIVDVGSDVINSLDLLDQNATEWLLKSTKICECWKHLCSLLCFYELMAYHIAKNRGLSVDTPANQDGGQSSETDSLLNSPEK